MGYNEFWIGNKRLLSLKADTVMPEKVLDGVTFHDSDGNERTGNCKYDKMTTLLNNPELKTEDDKKLSPVQSVQMQKGTVAFVNKGVVKGSLEAPGVANVQVEDIADLIPNRDEDGHVAYFNDTTRKIWDGIRVLIRVTDDEGHVVLSPTNIRAGKKILGVTGSFTGLEDYYTAQPTVNSKLNGQVFSAGDFQGTNQSGQAGKANAISQIFVNGVSVTRVPNQSNVDGAAADGWAVHIAQGELYTLPWERDN